MKLFRVFSWDRFSQGSDAGGPLFVPRMRQGSGRHDNPSLYGAIYCSLEPVSCIAEAIQAFRGQQLTAQDLERQGDWVLSLASFELPDISRVVDLDDPVQLDARQVRPSAVATGNRQKTQALSKRIYDEGAAGFLWWSTLEGRWINCTLFAERAAPRLSLTVEPLALGIHNLDLAAAARKIGVRIQ